MGRLHMETLSLNRRPTGTAAKLVIAELQALCGIIKRATADDGELVKSWSQSTIVNVLYSVTRTDRITRMVRQAGERSQAFEMSLAWRASNGCETDSLRQAAISSVRGLIKAIEEI
jgi:hypothetical protein